MTGSIPRARRRQSVCPDRRVAAAIRRQNGRVGIGPACRPPPEVLCQDPHPAQKVRLRWPCAGSEKRLMPTRGRARARKKSPVHLEGNRSSPRRWRSSDGRRQSHHGARGFDPERVVTRTAGSDPPSSSVVLILCEIRPLRHLEIVAEGITSAQRRFRCCSVARGAVGERLPLQSIAGAEHEPVGRRIRRPRQPVVPRGSGCLGGPTSAVASDSTRAALSVYVSKARWLAS